MKALAALSVVAAALLPHAGLPPGPMTLAAQDFLASLSPEMRGQAIYPFDSPSKTEWTYVPGKRKGVDWNEMTEAQRSKAKALLRASLSEKGYSKVEAIRQLELVLRDMENGNIGRDPGSYWFVFFGEPNNETPWAWRYEGHHVSLTFGSRGSTLVSSTPQFLGSNPAKVLSGPDKGKRVLGMEQDLGFKLAESLTTSQLKEAVINKTAPADIVTASSRRAGIVGHLGLSYAKMTPGQRSTLRELLAHFSEVQAKGEQQHRLKKIADEGYDHLVFAWMGPVERKGKHYYRIQGESFVIEYDNTQDDGNQIHTAWRDFSGDFGEDLLAEHYAASHRHHQHDHDGGQG